jgi:hypothetical protein
MLRQPPSPHTDLMVSTACHDCYGEGFIGDPRQIVLTSEIRAVGYQARPCAACETSGWLPGLAIPI